MIRCPIANSSQEPGSALLQKQPKPRHKDARSRAPISGLGASTSPDECAMCTEKRVHLKIQDTERRKSVAVSAVWQHPISSGYRKKPQKVRGAFPKTTRARVPTKSHTSHPLSAALALFLFPKPAPGVFAAKLGARHVLPHRAIEKPKSTGECFASPAKSCFGPIWLEKQRELFARPADFRARLSSCHPFATALAALKWT